MTAALIAAGVWFGALFAWRCACLLERQTRLLYDIRELAFLANGIESEYTPPATEEQP